MGTTPPSQVQKPSCMATGSISRSTPTITREATAMRAQVGRATPAISGPMHSTSSSQLTPIISGVSHSFSPSASPYW